MPARMTLEKINGALEQRRIKKNLDSYAVGILAYEQKQYRKSQTALENKLELLEKSSPAYQNILDQLHANAKHPELGFYYTIALFNQLRGTNPRKAKRMIQALLSFDTTGLYLLNEEPILLDGKTFVLDDILKIHGIDTMALKAAALQNHSNTTYISDEPPPIEKTSKTSLTFALPAYVNELAPDIQGLLKKLRAEMLSKSLFKRMSQPLFNFDLVSQLPTQANINAFILIWVEMLEHAKMQDSAKLYTVNTSPPEGAKHGEYSTVAFLQNSLSNWLLLSLIQAPSTDSFNQRMRFIMAFFAKANQKSPGLPTNASADMYLPLFTLSHVFSISALQSHPAIERVHSLIMEKLNGLHEANSITRYTNQIKLPRERTLLALFSRARHLPPMRMFMTTHLVLREEGSSLVHHSSLKKAAIASAHERLGSGNSIYNYFNPKHTLTFKTLSKMSSSTIELFNQQLTVKALFEGVYALELRDILRTACSLHQQNPPEIMLREEQCIHRTSDDIEMQLQTLQRASFSQGPIIIYQEKSGDLMCCAGSAAFDYIKSQVLNISEQISELSGNDNIENIAGWCSTILRGVSRLDALLTSGVKAKADESKGANGSTSTVAHSGLFKTSSGELKRNRALSGGEPFEQAEHAPSRSKSDIQITPTGCAMSDVTTNIKSVGNIQITDPVVLKRNRTLSGGEPFEQAEQASFRSKLDTQVAHADAAKSDVVPRAKLGLGINLFKLAPAEPKSNWTVSDGVELHTAHHPTSAEILISLV